MAESQLTPSLTIATPFDEKEKELLALFERTDRRLVYILIGVVRVLNDKDNPDRLHQAAHSIREITIILTRDLEHNGQIGKELSSLLVDLDSIFEKAIALMPVSEIKDDKKTEREYVKQKYIHLKGLLAKGAYSLKQRMRSYYGDIKEIIRLPKEIRERRLKRVKEWVETHNDYFIAHAHHGRDEISEAEYMVKWDIIKSCIIDALSRFYERDVAILDKAIAMETPPNE